MQLPPEWWPQSAILLTWPHGDGDWGADLPRVEQVFVDLAREIAARQGLIISTHDDSLRRATEKRLRHAGVNMQRVHLYTAASNDVWVRDHGPLTIIEDGGLQLLDFRFNGWGGKHPAGQDDRLTAELHTQGAFAELPLQCLETVIEGGALEVNGNGSLLTRRHCLDRDSRNPGLSTADLEAVFHDYFGCHQVHWLESGLLSGDDTDGHIDTLARFTATNSIVYQACTDSADEHYAPLKAMEAELHELRDTQGSPYLLHALPLPSALYNAQGQRLPAGYANFLIMNEAVLVPAYNDPADAQAVSILGECFPGRQMISIDCRPLVAQFGSLHCATMQLPSHPST